MTEDDVKEADVPRRSRTTPLLVAALAVIVVVLGGVFVWNAAHSSKSPSISAPQTTTTTTTPDVANAAKEAVAKADQTWAAYVNSPDPFDEAKATSIMSAVYAQVHETVNGTDGVSDSITPAVYSAQAAKSSGQKVVASPEHHIEVLGKNPTKVTMSDCTNASLLNPLAYFQKDIAPSDPHQFYTFGQTAELLDGIWKLTSSGATRNLEDPKADPSKSAPISCDPSQFEATAAAIDANRHTSDVWYELAGQAGSFDAQKTKDAISVIASGDAGSEFYAEIEALRNQGFIVTGNSDAHFEVVSESLAKVTLRTCEKDDDVKRKAADGSVVASDPAQYLLSTQTMELVNGSWKQTGLDDPEKEVQQCNPDNF